jgi:uncharacterized glyoxalase superfamily protein PhnB
MTAEAAAYRSFPILPPSTRPSPLVTLGASRLIPPVAAGFDSPATLGATTVRVEVFSDDPDAFIARAVAAGADGSLDAIRDHQAPWGVHRQGGFTDPFGHVWLVGDKSPLTPFSGQ